ncbi:hypothetical protein MAR_031207 [Mya arenaria]|uniref:Uncharacterized protein n=1 Tax=Mya arenaria TaxID=6604 RepID=A0ABY7F7F3_MYAAR|nr:hypothetical protein MAR_031207 [Mya arenaria]
MVDRCIRYRLLQPTENGVPRFYGVNRGVAKPWVLIAIVVDRIFNEMCPCYNTKNRRTHEEGPCTADKTRRDYDIVDTNLREVELNDLRYETLEVNEVHRWIKQLIIRASLNKKMTSLHT